MKEVSICFRSAILFGKARILEDDAEKRKALEILTARYSPDMEKSHQLQAIEKEYNAVCMIELAIDHMSGKEAIELVKAKQETAQ